MDTEETQRENVSVLDHLNQSIVLSGKDAAFPWPMFSGLTFITLSSREVTASKYC